MPSDLQRKDGAHTWEIPLELHVEAEDNLRVEACILFYIKQLVINWGSTGRSLHTLYGVYAYVS